MGKLHNKKRNVGIIYEQIITFICSQTIEGNNKDAKIKPTPIAQPVKGMNNIPKEIALAAFTNNTQTLII